MSYFEKPVDGAVAQQTDDAYLAFGSLGQRHADP